MSAGKIVLPRLHRRAHPSGIVARQPRGVCQGRAAARHDDRHHRPPRDHERHGNRRHRLHVPGDGGPAHRRALHAARAACPPRRWTSRARTSTTAPSTRSMTTRACRALAEMMNCVRRHPRRQGGRRQDRRRAGAPQEDRRPRARPARKRPRCLYRSGRLLRPRVLRRSTTRIAKLKRGQFIMIREGTAAQQPRGARLACSHSSTPSAACSARTTSTRATCLEKGHIDYIMPRGHQHVRRRIPILDRQGRLPPRRALLPAQ